MRKEQKINIITGIAFFAYGIWMLARGLSVTVQGKTGDYGPGFMPRFIGGTISLLSLLLVITTLVGIWRGAAYSSSSKETVIPDYKSIIATFILLALYMIALSPVGFILSSVIYVFLQIMVIANKPSKKFIMMSAVIAVVMPVVVYYVFVDLFFLLLPAGILG
ncbi:MAG: tripartite tricarboxylate transporter TctB family protein [Spirochaetales bacterium]|nr:tripartite tricarboxylate transporter TctB family protein [Spirochaetales bacterium]